MMNMKLIGLALVLICNGWAQTDSQLAALHATLQALHAQADVSAVNPGGGPRLTVAKHQLRDWIESQLGPVEQEGDRDKSLRKD